MMAEGVRQFAPTLVMFFAIAQFLQYFDWTHLGDVIAVGASQLLDQSNIPVTLIFLLVFALLSVVNVIITSGSAMWSIMAPVLVPMLMLLDVPADTTQAIFRIAGSGSTSISSSPAVAFSATRGQVATRARSLSAVAERSARCRASERGEENTSIRPSEPRNTGSSSR